MSNDLTAEGSILISHWLQAVETVSRAKHNLNRAECDEQNAQHALGNWLMPSDMKPGEKIAVWFGDSLIQVELAPIDSFALGTGEKHTAYQPKVTVRTRGDLQRAS